MKSIAQIKLRDVPDKTFISVYEDEEDIEWIYLKIATVPAEVNKGIEEVSLYGYSGRPCITEETDKLVYIYNDEDVLKEWM